MKPKPGEVWLADLGIAAKLRPVVVLSREDPDPPRSLVIYIPLTTQMRGSRYEVDLGKLSFLREHSVANVQGLGSTPELRMENRLGRLPDELLARVKDAVRFAIEL